LYFDKLEPASQEQEDKLNHMFADSQLGQVHFSVKKMQNFFFIKARGEGSWMRSKGVKSSMGKFEGSEKIKGIFKDIRLD